MATAPTLVEKYGPWALVTGASSGMGEQFARRLARAGFSLLMVARRAERLRVLEQELGRRRRIEVVGLAEDLADRAALDRIAAAAAARDVGLIVSNAGFGLKGPFERSDRAKVESMFDTNARAPLILLHTLLPGLLRRGKGGIILTGSIEGEAPFPWWDLPVVLGTAGGIGLIVGPAGLFAANYLMISGHLRDAGRMRILITLVFGLMIILAGLPAMQTTFVHLLSDAFDLLRKLSAPGS